MYTHDQCFNLGRACRGETKVLREWTAGDCDWQDRICLRCGAIITTPRKDGCVLPHHWATQRDLWPILTPFVPFLQLRTLRDCCRGEESAAFYEILGRLSVTLETIPRVGGSVSAAAPAADPAAPAAESSPLAHLHYFTGSCDWWITELDSEPEQLQAYGLASLGYESETGYIAITELVAQPMVELDLHWTPKTIARIRAERGE